MLKSYKKTCVTVIHHQNIFCLFFRWKYFTNAMLYFIRVRKWFKRGKNNFVIYPHFIDLFCFILTFYNNDYKTYLRNSQSFWENSSRKKRKIFLNNIKLYYCKICKRDLIFFFSSCIAPTDVSVGAGKGSQLRFHLWIYEILFISFSNIFLRCDFLCSLPMFFFNARKDINLLHL